MQLTLIRHGETVWNLEKRVQGLTDIELNETGIDQARKLALSLQDFPIDTIYSSPLKRAFQTAEIINRFHRKDIRVEPGLMEMDQGEFEGLTFQELLAREKDFIRKWIADPESVRMPGGESLAELQNRAWPPVEKLLAAGQNALIVSHNFTIAAILCRLRNIRLSEFRSTCVDNASRTHIRIHNGEAHIEAINDVRHLKTEADV
ncbi:MAG TPA: histidine phosphatase family protein [Smithellaceae bacterium]|nr:histidine phosphatase family protein [Smithellaceae bacterium]HRV44855.1 histidine phosphatase family protein [Smithellaceae bacterium]